MGVLGLNHGEINSAAALVNAGQLVAACPEERFNRQKQTKAFPARSVRFCLDSVGGELSSCDAVAQGWNPGALWNKFNPVLSGVRTKREHYFYSALPAITHVDASARLQTVTEDQNPFFGRVIRAFEKLTAVGVVLNTSFNINNEPIVLSPDDALTTFFNSGLLQLAVGSYLIDKSS